MLQDLANDEQLELNLLNDKVTPAEDKFFYDLDADLKYMRDKVDTNVDNDDVWIQISKSLQEVICFIELLIEALWEMTL